MCLYSVLISRLPYQWNITTYPDPPARVLTGWPTCTTFEFTTHALPPTSPQRPSSLYIPACRINIYVILFHTLYFCRSRSGQDHPPPPPSNHSPQRHIRTHLSGDSRKLGVQARTHISLRFGGGFLGRAPRWTFLDAVVMQRTEKDCPATDPRD